MYQEREKGLFNVGIMHSYQLFSNQRITPFTHDTSGAFICVTLILFVSFPAFYQHCRMKRLKWWFIALFMLDSEKHLFFLYQIVNNLSL